MIVHPQVEENRFDCNIRGVRLQRAPVAKDRTAALKCMGLII